MIRRTFCLLVLLAAPLAAAEPTSTEISAVQLLADARDQRIVWNGIPGFTAELVVSLDGKTETGTIDVSSDGEMKISGVSLAEDKTIGRALDSLIAHRFRDEANEAGEEAYFDPKDPGTALGKLIEKSGGLMESQSRVKDGVIHEVIRRSKTGSFTITVVNVYRNPEGKYLPQVFTISNWDADGNLTASATVENVWKRVGDWDLPVSHTAIRTSDKGERKVVRVEFNHPQLKTK
ncbi:DUF3386 domain-containing protein [Blastopirellula sp. JC732]|uniref:DUF3386 domain-containing protein n=1 Tax=Blastopirellula sediminis TaxID=2894196 RepID=A0A9X1MPX7_9BACT|nr:DUF3386 family protein [Blastopirellula sediminis]MCC9606847.1 DUF3386 domain-containing protein [Blastopirellula sediminis]MCC9629857.1 DUF3386 domain-containing protein [Blastopirellula sediminis]